MLAFLRDANTSKSVTDIFNQLDGSLGKGIFNKLFPVILTDNGSEFSNPKAIEYRETMPFLRTNVFYCDAGATEVNHELIRRVLPKGTSFNNLTQEDIDLMMNHINSYKRKKLNNRSPYETFSFYHGEEVLHKLGCSPVAASSIMLNLLFSKNKFACRQPFICLRNKGVDSPITKTSRGSQPPFGMPVIIIILQ